jgi:hypothetical protein
MIVRGVLLALTIGVVAGYALATVYDSTHRDDAFRLAEPKPTTIRALGHVKRPPKRPCDLAQDGCFDYVGGWCQAPCDTYSARATLVSVTHLKRPPFYGWLLVLRDGTASIAARVMSKPKAKPGDRVRVSGVLFFPTPRDRDGRHAPNGAELSPVLTIGVRS